MLKDKCVSSVPRRDSSESAQFIYDASFFIRNRRYECVVYEYVLFMSYRDYLYDSNNFCMWTIYVNVNSNTETIHDDSDDDSDEGSSVAYRKNISRIGLCCPHGVDVVLVIGVYKTNVYISFGSVIIIWTRVWVSNVVKSGPPTPRPVWRLLPEFEEFSPRENFSTSILLSPRENSFTTTLQLYS